MKKKSREFSRNENLAGLWHTPPLGVSTTEQLLEVLGDKNEEKVEPTLVVGRVRLDKADNNDKAANARLNITSSRARA